MSFFRNWPLKRLALYLLGALFFIFLVEFFIIRYKIDILEEIEEKKDFARSAQLEGQETAYLVELHFSGKELDAAGILARVNELEHKLKILGNGGRIDGSDVFLNGLSRLPRITYDNLFEHWNTYRNNLLSGLAAAAVSTAQVPSYADTTAVQADSTSGSIAVSVPIDVKNGAALLPGQWLTVSNWYEKLLADLTEEAEMKKLSVENWFFFFVIFDLILFGSLYFLFNRNVIRPLHILADYTTRHHQESNLPANEFGALQGEVNAILQQLTDATEFVAAIGEGKLDFDYRSLDSSYATGKNRLADSLISMQQKLKILNEEEQRRQWANEGLTKFVDILRSSNDNISSLGDKIISALVKYTNGNQGGLYILNDEDEHNKYLELISLFAFDNKKFESQKVRLGEGILGQTFLEKETTLLTEIPEEYIRITSGLGGATPKSLLIVPLKVDKDVYGIVEVASFKNFQQHEIAFVEKLAETIASTLASVKVAQKNRHLIEQFQEQTEEMRSQEEEMRQNMEELQATQEEISRKEQEYVARIRELERDQVPSVSKEEFERANADLNKQIVEYQGRIRELENKLAQKPPRENDWALAEQVEKELRVQLEAMRISAEENSKKQG
jgi:GAF domain-containing protein